MSGDIKSEVPVVRAFGGAAPYEVLVPIQHHTPAAIMGLVPHDDFVVVEKLPTPAEAMAAMKASFE